MRTFALGFLAVALCFALGTSAVAQHPAGASISGQPEDKERVPDIFEDVTQLERVDANTAREIVRKFQLENPSRREFSPNRASQGYDEDDSKPALKLDKVAVGPAGVLMELTGLARSRNTVSAVMRRDTLRLRNSRGLTSALMAFEGVTELRDRRGGSALIVSPGDKLYLLFDKFDDYFAFSISHVNRDGRESVYFELDPRFDERYEAMYSAANTPNGMKEFVVEFARNDPKGRVLPVFSKLIGQMRAQGSFEGYHTAYQLMGEPRDYAGMQRTAVSAAHREVMESIEAEKQAEVRRREEAKLAEARRQEAQRLESQRVEQARLAEQRCLADPGCLREMEERRAACVRSIQNCRMQCDRLSGSGSYGGFFANLAAAGMSAVCSRGCRCDTSFGDLLAKFNDMSSGSSSGTSRVRASAAESLTASPAAGDTSRRSRVASADKRTTTGVASAAGESSRRSEVPADKRGTVAASDYVCTVNCRGPEGRAYLTVKAGDSAEAAKLVDPQGHQVCKSAGFQRATDIRMAASQCQKR